MDDTPSNSQRTNEDPTGPVSIAAQATLTLTPDGPEAMLAFSQVCDWLLEQNDSDLPQAAARKHAEKFMWIARDQVHDKDVQRLVRHLQTGTLSSSSPTSAPSHDGRSNHSEHADSAEVEVESLKCNVWTGCYFIDLSKPPLNPARGWTAGRIRTGEILNDMVLCLSDDPVYGVRQRHAVFQIKSTNRVSVHACSNRASFQVNGEALVRNSDNKEFFLNNSSAMFRFGNLSYKAEYGPFARDQRHLANLKQYLEQFFGSDVSLDPGFAPTPTSNLQIRQWSLTNAGTIGVGGGGRVSVGMNSNGRVVALKRVAVSSDARPMIRQHQRAMEEITRLAIEKAEDRVLKLVEIISDDLEGTHRHADVWFVLEPVVTPMPTVVQQGGLASDERESKIRQAIVAVLGALEFLHSNQWIHGDMKPSNIGARNWQQDASSIVLLDIDECIRTSIRGETLPANPGSSGTVGWISPERELEGFDETTDIWCVGVIALWMLRGGSHPWMMRLNPWRSEPEAVARRRQWMDMYTRALTSLPSTGCADLISTVLQMVRFPYAECEPQKQGRPRAADLLGTLSGVGARRAKKMRQL